MSERPGLVFDELDPWLMWHRQQQPMAVRVVRRCKQILRRETVPPTLLRPWVLRGACRRLLGRCPHCGYRDVTLGDFCSVEHMRMWFARLTRSRLT